MIKHYTPAVLLGIALLIPFAALAATPEGEDVEAFEEIFGSGPQEEDVYRSERLLVTATGSLKPVRLAPSVATVITKEEIEAIGATNLDEILETVPGFHVTPSGTFFTPIWSLRGIHTSVNPEVLLLINGVPFTSNYVGNRGFRYRMPVSMISRVEVVRGPGSALHGADAYSGVVNVITKDNFEIGGTETGARAGSFDTYDAWAQHGGQYGGWDISFGIEWQKSDGDDDSIVEKDYLHAIGLAFLSNAPGHLDNSYETLDANLQLRKGDWDFHLYGQLLESGGGPGAAQAITYGTDQDIQSLLADLTYSNDHLLDDWDLSCRLYYSYMHTDSYLQFFPTTFLNMFGNPIYTSKDGGIEVAGIYDGFSAHKIRLGAGWKSYDIEPDEYTNFGPAAGANQFGPLVHVTDSNLRYMDDANRQLFYGLVQDEWNLARGWELTAGVRYDEYSDFGETINPRAALVWETRYDLITKLLYGKAFRAPSFSEQYVKNNPVGVGNQELDPETIQTVELAFDYQPTADVGIKLNLFHYEAEDLIALAGPTLPQTYENFAEQEGNGFEIELDWQLLEQLQIRSNFAYQKSENKTIDHDVHDAPEMQFYLNPHWEFLPDWSLDGQYYWVAGRNRAQGDPREEIDDYHLVNLTLRWKNIAQYYDVAISVRNLFDEDVREPSPYDATAPEGAFIANDYPIKSRMIWAEIRMHF
ncbi:MAG: TonB-dependent receptor [Desulfobulbaceae bacterium]|nr:TonB-dependent receptor [Desulfobulbaceae bacterium]